jgi:hypothetical protein
MSNPITTTWTAADGPHTVSTERNQGESTADWIARHFAAVSAAMERHPPV